MSARAPKISFPTEESYGSLLYVFERPDGTAVREPVLLDVYDANAAYLAAYKAAPDSPWKGFSAWLVAQGFPPHSSFTASQVIESVQAELDRLKKAAACSGSAG